MLTAQELLKNALEKRRSKNPRYSLRALARDCKVSPALLSQLMSGKKGISLESAKKISEALFSSASARKRFIRSIIYSGESTDLKGVPGRVLSPDEFKEIANWQSYAILSVLGLDPKRKLSSEKIAESLNLSLKNTNVFLENLERLKLIRENKDNTFTRLSEELTTSNDISSAAIQSYHLDQLKLAKEKISTPVSQRSYLSFSIPLSVKNVPIAKKMIVDFCQDISQSLDTGDKNAVYNLNVQFFPVCVLDNK